jgi:cyclic-di-GMP phosphodiesterase TipF (flagellum assembly factor)
LQQALASGFANQPEVPELRPTQMEEAEPGIVNEPAGSPTTSLRDDQPQTDFEDDELGDRIFFALEPVIDIPSRRTAHYRLHLSTELGGEELASDRLLHYASRVGKRPVLDLIAAREALQLLAKLRLRDPELNIFMDIGAETLAEPQALARLVVARREAGDAAQGLVFELPHAALAGLSERSLEGLAALAREGVHFALANVSVSALDLQAMNTLNVRHVGVAAGSIDAEDGPSTSLVGFAQVARLSRIGVIITGLGTVALVPKLASVTRLACGPCFALPRRVKRHDGRAQETMPSFNIAA